MSDVQSIEIQLPFPPSVNHYWRHVGRKVLISARGRQYREAVAKLALASKCGRLGEERLSIEIVVHAPNKKRRDLDNLLKVPLDALCKAGVYDDDSQIDCINIWRGRTKPKDGCIVVRLCVAESTI